MLNRKAFFIREHVAFMKLSGAYDILDPETQQQLGIAKEKPGLLIHVLRFLFRKQSLPTKVFVYEGNSFERDDMLLFSIARGLPLFRTKVKVLDREGKLVGWFRSKIFTLSGAFSVFDASGNKVALVKGDWKGWNFRMTDKSGNEIGVVTKKWAGIGKEIFTSADNYIISLNEEPTPALAAILLAAGLAVDLVYKER